MEDAASQSENSAARRRNFGTFQALFEAHQSMVFNVCTRMLDNVQEAEDLTQDVFFKAYRYLPITGWSLRTKQRPFERMSFYGP